MIFNTSQSSDHLIDPIIYQIGLISQLKDIIIYDYVTNDMKFYTLYSIFNLKRSISPLTNTKARLIKQFCQLKNTQH